MKKYLEIIKMIHKLNPSTLIYGFFKTLSRLASPYLSLFFTAMLLNEFVGLRREAVLFRTVLLFLVIQFVVSVLEAFFTMKSDLANEQIVYMLDDALTKKSLDMDYSQLANPDTRLLFQKAEEGSNFNGGIHTFVNYVLDEFFKMAIALVIAGGAILQLVLLKAPGDSALASFANSWVFALIVLILLLVPIVTSSALTRKGAQIQLKMFGEVTTVNREMAYYSSTLFSDVDSGKTIRLYHAKDMLMKVFYEKTKYFLSEFRNTLIRIHELNGVGEGVTLICVAALYLLIGVKSQLGLIAIGSVLMYVGYIQTLVNTLVSGAAQLAQGSTIIEYLGFYNDYLNLPIAKSGDKQITKTNETIFEFKNVSFSYPGSECLILDNVSLTINPNERLAVVGKNGAGKTTFIKLLTRLYEPTAGVILCNGIDISTLDLSSYYDLLSVVFQDFNLYPFGIDENIALSETIDDRRITDALNLVGIKDKIDSLPKGVKTTIKGQMDEGVRLSGGQSQKLAIARAWYKDAALVILDEPTAALDPISEFEIYNHFNDIMDQKSAIFVSHRMSSCQFCDRIVVFADGGVVEDGTHHDLMQVKTGLYRSLFEAQAKYYR